MAAKTTGWIVGTSVVAIALAAGAWFGLIAPTLVDAGDQRTAAADQRERNELLEMQLARLKADAKNLERYQADLAAIQAKVPSTAGLAELTRQLDSVATSTGVTIVDVSPGTPSAFVVPGEPSPEPTATESAPSSGSEAATPTAEPTTATTDGTATGTAGAADGLFTTPLSVTSVGTYDQTTAFLDALQQLMPRLFVVSQVSTSSLDAAAAQGGRPEIHDGDLETTIAGVVLTLQDGATAQPDPGAAGSEPGSVPVPGDQRNPFGPVAQ